MRVSDAKTSQCPRRIGRPWLPWSVGSMLVVSGLFVLYLRQAMTWRVDSDAAANAFQAWDMLHGNVLLHGWWLSDVAFYTTELPEYVLVEAVRGLRPDVVHVCSALTYTLLVLSAALLAKGRAHGREGIVRALLAAGIMLAPGIFRGTDALLGAPNHTGTGVLVLLILLLLDRAEGWQDRKLRWLVPAAACLMLTWVQVADPVATYAVAAPLTLVGVGRASVALIRRQARSREWGYDLALAAAAAGSVPLAEASLAAIRSAGGFSVAPLSGPLLAGLASVPTHAQVTGEAVLVLFGADFFGQPSRVGTALALLHLAAVTAAALALLAGLRDFFGRLDRVGQILVAGTVIMLGAAVFGTRVPNVSFAHEIAIVLPFSAVLAGRLLGGPLIRARLEPALAVMLAAYLGALCYAAAGAPTPPQNQAAADWLVAHDLTYGLGGYWQASSVTLASGGRVTVAPLAYGAAAARHWEANAAWYDPRTHYANFVITKAPSAANWPGFGRPARTYHDGPYTIMVWRRNLLLLLSGNRT
jgi:hypothetical protein